MRSTDANEDANEDTNEDTNKHANEVKPNDEKGKQRSARDAAAVLHEKLIDALTPGFQAEFDPDEAEQAGAFVEDALSEQDAIDSDIDLMAASMPAAANDDDGE